MDDVEEDIEEYEVADSVLDDDASVWSFAGGASGNNCALAFGIATTLMLTAHCPNDHRDGCESGAWQRWRTPLDPSFSFISVHRCVEF